MMTITQIETVTDKKCAVFLDGEFAFVLYKGELRKYGIVEGEELPPDLYAEIMHVLLPHRARLRCMNLLQARPYTRKQLLDKLKQGKYPDSVMENALAYVESFGYVDDAAYARSYVEDHLETRSLRRIEEDLARRGIDRETVRQAMEEVQEQEGEQNEERMIRRLLERKNYNPSEADYKEKQRIQAFLYRKGFSPDKIRRVMDCEYMMEDSI